MKTARTVVIILNLMVIGSSGGCRAGEKEASGEGVLEAAQPDFEGLVEIPAGTLNYGATEQEFQFFLNQSTFSFPGMEQRLRNMFVMPPRLIQIPRFFIDEFEVTNERYHDFLNATGYRPEDRREFVKHWGGGKPPDWALPFPVVYVSPVDAAAFCSWRGLRLPTDEEWERAARGNDGRMFPWGHDLPATQGPNVGTGKSEPAGNRPFDRSPFGVYDLAGNVAEITATQVPMDGKNFHTLRGGSYSSGLRESLTYARMIGLEPGDRLENVGFRCAGTP